MHLHEAFNSALIAHRAARSKTGQQCVCVIFNNANQGKLATKTNAAEETQTMQMILMANQMCQPND